MWRWENVEMSTPYFLNDIQTSRISFPHFHISTFPYFHIFTFVQLFLHMEITFNTPALLFPAISLLLLAYTNRYLALANLIRKLHDEYMKGEKQHLLLKQIKILRVRINLVRGMQWLGVFSFLCCVITMYGVYGQWIDLTRYIFALSLLSLLASLVISLLEISQSTKALEWELSDMEELEKTNFFSDLWGRKQQKEE